MSEAYSEFRELMKLGKYLEAACYAEGEQLDGSGQNVFWLTLKFERLSQRSQRGVLECLSKLKNWQEILLNISTWEMAEQDKYRYRVKAMAALGRHDEAIEDCNKWLQVQPHNHNALWELMELEIRRDGLDNVLSKMGKADPMSVQFSGRSGSFPDG